jgi:hypothetical protein
MGALPYYTSDTLIEAVQRKISFPLSQSTFTMTDLLDFANEEMMISQVPAVLQFHEEYFVFRYMTPLVNNTSRYGIPTRAIGMRLRDLKWADQNNNLFDMTRINADDKAFFQRNIGSNQAVHKFYVEGNTIVLTPAVTVSPTGSLLMTYFLRPNQLVPDDRAATVQSFVTPITLQADYLNNLDNISFNTVPYTAVTSIGSSISTILPTPNNSLSVTITTSTPHQMLNGQTVTLSGTNSGPSVDGTYTVSIITPTEYQITAQIVNPGTSGTSVCLNQFLINASNSVVTATNFANAVNAVGNGFSAMTSTPPTATVNVLYNNILDTFVPTNTIGFLYNPNLTGIIFDNLPATYTDPTTSLTTPLYVVGANVDFLQTNPGHQTYAIEVPIVSISGNTAYFETNELVIYTDTNQVTAPINLIIGDYICLANECIIPQVPPELHSGLAERVCARILEAIGDQTGLATVNQKLQDIAVREGNLVDNRSEGTPMKVLNRYSLLRQTQMGTRHRL